MPDFRRETVTPPSLIERRTAEGDRFAPGSGSTRPLDPVASLTTRNSLHKDDVLASNYKGGVEQSDDPTLPKDYIRTARGVRPMTPREITERDAKRAQQ